MSRETTEEGIERGKRNALAAWILIGSIGIAVLVSVLDGDFLWSGFGLVALAVALIPVGTYRRATAMVPWESLLLVAIPILSVPFGPVLPRSVAVFLSVAALALVVSVEMDAFSTVELSPSFAVLFVVVTTMAIAGAWAVIQWVVDVTTGMQNLQNLRAVMWSLFAATGVGIGAGILFAAYFQRIDPRRFGFRDGGKRRESEEMTAVKSSEGWLSDRQQRRLVRALQVVLVGVLAFGVYRANIGIIVNTAVALALMELPAVLERDYRLPIDAGLTLWIVVPVFLHAIGTVGLYHSIGLWDQLTHTLSSSLVAAAGYTTVRALDIHADSVYLPKTFMVLFILLFTLAFGVLWELLEFGLDGLATTLGTASVLSQYSLENTMLDLVFDSVGGIIVAIWGAAHLSNVSDAVAARFDTGTE
ncbi:hypothetical protein [Haladaptatus sp. DYF46]|uniref:hypothetical protein n=1 Tax=Haladaptatus sp. DYF46 TaxID=2886041 RepID=UPI0031831AA3